MACGVKNVVTIPFFRRVGTFSRNDGLIVGHCASLYIQIKAKGAILIRLREEALVGYIDQLFCRSATL